MRVHGNGVVLGQWWYWRCAGVVEERRRDAHARQLESRPRRISRPGKEGAAIVLKGAGDLLSFQFTY